MTAASQHVMLHADVPSLLGIAPLLHKGIHGSLQLRGDKTLLYLALEKTAE
jgi:hypothetical protein